MASGEEGLGAAFPSVSEDWLEQIIFKLCYAQHGGSGLNFTPDYVENLPVDRAIRFAEMLDERRQEEARILRNPKG